MIIGQMNPLFAYEFLKVTLEQIFTREIAIKLLSAKFLARKLSKINTNETTLRQSQLNQHLRTLNMNQFYDSWSSDFLFRGLLLEN